MKVKGTVFTGVLRGSSMIDSYYHRLINILGFAPFRGTLNVKLALELDIKKYSTKKISHILLDATEHVDAYLAPIIFHAGGRSESCWAMWQTSHVYGKDTIEVVSKENMKSKFGIKDGDEAEIEFSEQPKKLKKIPGMGLVAKLYGRETQLTKS